MEKLPVKNELKDFLSLGLDRCLKATNASSGSVFLFDNEKDELVLEVVKTKNGSFPQQVTEKLGERVVGRVALERKPILVENVDQDPRLQEIQKYEHYKTKSFLSVPLEISGSLIGVVNITDKTTGEAFNSNDLKDVLNISKYFSNTLYRVKEYLQRQRNTIDNLNKQIKELKNSVEHAKKYSSLGKLVGGLVHEINNPLDGVIRYVNLAHSSAKDGDSSKEYLEEAKTGLTRITTVVRSMLDFAWSLSSNEGYIDINHAIEETVFTFRDKLIDYNISVEKHLSPRIKKIPDYRLKLVLNNMIKNACEAMKNGGKLFISSHCKGDSVEIRFKDTGTGISKELQQKIFEPFFTTKSIGEGSGLGLAISSEIIKRYGGSIQVESSQDSGTSFVIKIPRKEQNKK